MKAPNKKQKKYEKQYKQGELKSTFSLHEDKSEKKQFSHLRMKSAIDQANPIAPKSNIDKFYDDEFINKRTSTKTREKISQRNI